jgi:hypothetical protein
MSYNKTYLLKACDGPEGIEIYTSEDEGVVDWSSTFPAVYLQVNTHDAMIKLGPFQMPAIFQQLAEQIKDVNVGV